eukprot:XP_001709341.1 Hypothetical protein GL50803_20277 [Giardia lamblia ATCC 50803]
MIRIGNEATDPISREIIGGETAETFGEEIIKISGEASEVTEDIITVTIITTHGRIGSKNNEWGKCRPEDHLYRLYSAEQSSLWRHTTSDGWNRWNSIFFERMPRETAAGDRANQL